MASSGVFGLSGLFTPDASTEAEVDEHRKLRVGMLFYTLNDVILAIFFIGSYIFLRDYDTNLRWFPPGTGRDPFGQETFVMGIAVAGGLAYAIAQIMLKLARPRPFRLLLALALALYFIDLAGQVWIMSHLPFTPGTGGGFASAFSLLSGYHIYHMAVLIFLGIGVVVRAFKGKYTDRNMSGVQVIGYYWYWGALYELAFWLLVLIQPPCFGC